MIVAQRIDTALHVGTHFDGAMHATDNRKGDMASLRLDYLVNRGVVVDISEQDVGLGGDHAGRSSRAPAPTFARAISWSCIPAGTSTTRGSRSRIG